MKFGTVGFTLALLVSPVFAQAPQPKGYTVGVCSPKMFYSIHLKEDANNLILDLSMDEPGVAEQTKIFIKYEFAGVDTHGNGHYKWSHDKTNFEIVINPEKTKGLSLVNGEVQDILFVSRDDDAKNMAAFTDKQYQSCKNIFEDKPVDKSSHGD